MPSPRREDYSNVVDWQDANVRWLAQETIGYCEARRREREAAEDVDWTREPEPTADGLEDLL